MPYRYKYIPKENTPFDISHIKFWTGIVLGLCYAFCLYGFTYMTRESLRVFSFDKIYGMWPLSEDAHHCYNLCFAFIAVVIGQSICFKYWFDTNKENFLTPTIRKSSLVNDQTFLQWGFLSWFSKLAVFFALFLGATFNKGYQAIDIYKDHTYIFILFGVVLFFQSWIHIRRYFRSHATKWIFLSILSVSLFSFGLSKIEFINYKAIDEIAAQNSIYQKYDLQQAKTDFHESMPRKSYITDIYIVLKKNKSTPLEPILIFEEKEVEMDNLHKKIDLDIQQNQIITLIIDKKTPMIFVNELEGVLSQYSRIGYRLNKTNDDDHNTYLRKINASNQAFYHLKKTNSLLEKDRLEISLNTNGQCFVNGNNIPKEKLKDHILHSIVENPNYYISLDKKDDNTFQQYIDLLGSSKKAIHELRDLYAHELFAKDYYKLDQKQKITVQKKHPFRLVETSNYLFNLFEFYDELPYP